MLPLTKPALATLGLLAFLANWNDFLWPLYVLLSPETLTLPAGLANFQSANDIHYELLMAGAVIASVPRARRRAPAPRPPPCRARPP
ncbi:hypothetical protein ACLGIH_30050 [Streptomyces sp. HMX87]|uniref:hypothetical protein n=1 Tax=Streptomyces sp. HMX87 TaxID=3390849 RepID=UPI003A87C6D8